VDRRALFRGLVEKGLDAFFGKEDAGLFFEHADGARSGFESGKAVADGCGIEPFEGDIVGEGAQPCALYDGGIGGAEEEAARLLEEGFAGGLFKLGPEGIGCFDQGDVERAFVIGLADDAAFAVGGAFLVGRVETVET